MNDTPTRTAHNSNFEQGAVRRPDWLFEFKYDGFRGLLYAGKVRIRVKPYGGHGRQFERDDDLVGRYSGQCMSYFSRNLSCQFYRDGYDRGKV